MAPYRHYESPATGEIAAADGTLLFVRRWPVRPDARKGSALLVHGLGEHAGRYGHVAAALNALGVEVWAHDHRGFGKSGGARAKIPEANALMEDTRLVFDRLAESQAGQGPSAPILLGHSMGGAIAARAVTGGWIKPRALVLSSPGLRSHLNPILRGAARLLNAVAPNLVLPHGLPLHTISHDLQVLAEAKDDPLNHAMISPRITVFILDAGDAAIRDAGRLEVPTLILAAGDDRLVDVQGARDFAGGAPVGLCTLKIYPGLWHEIFNESEPDRMQVLLDLSEWLRERL
jgi:alpha-beta hydrolase superfamily lysophospholipase